MYGLFVSIRAGLQSDFRESNVIRAAPTPAARNNEPC